MNTHEGNKIIAAFDADKIMHLCNMGVSYKLYQISRFPFDAIPVQDLQYHSSWDWIMPVVKKYNGIIKTATEHVNFIPVLSALTNSIEIRPVWLALIECMEQNNKEQTVNK